jgi:hypothetical protein
LLMLRPGVVVSPRPGEGVGLVHPPVLASRADVTDNDAERQDGAQDRSHD